MPLTLDQTVLRVGAEGTETNSKSRPAKRTGIEWTRSLLYGALAAALLCWAGFYNGYPILTPDSGNYLQSGAFHVALWPFRAPGYGAFMKWTRLGTSTWLTIAAQALIVIYVLRETLIHLIGVRGKYIDLCLLLGACGLAPLTGLPWVVSELMPDVFAGVLLLSAFLLAFAGELSSARRVILASIAALCVAVHASLLPISILYAGALVVFRFTGRHRRLAPNMRSVLPLLLAPVLAAGLWTGAEYQSMGLGFSLSPAGSYWLLGRLFANGMAGDFLGENCPKRPFVSCRYLSDLPRTLEEFMFHHPLGDELRGHSSEVRVIVQGAIRANPGRFVLSSAKNTLAQLVAFRTGGETRLHVLVDYWRDVVQVIPKEFRPYILSRQFNDRLFPAIDRLTPIHIAVFWISLVACLAFAWTGRFGRLNTFLGAAIAFLAINAAVCASLSEVMDRYQSRVAWIIPFCLLAYICSFIRDRNGRAADQDPVLR